MSLPDVGNEQELRVPAAPLLLMLRGQRAAASLQERWLRALMQRLRIGVPRQSGNFMGSGLTVFAARDSDQALVIVNDADFALLKTVTENSLRLWVCTTGGGVGPSLRPRRKEFNVSAALAAQLWRRTNPNIEPE